MARAKKQKAPKPPKTSAAPPPVVLAGESRVVKVSSLKLRPQNARNGNIPAIKASIRANGFYGRVLVRRATMEVCLGNHRLQAMQELGATEIPAEILDIDEAAAVRILAVDNRASDLAGYDEAKLAALLRDIATAGHLDAVLYKQEDVDAILRRIAPTTPPPNFQDLTPGGMHLTRECPSCHFKF